MRYLLAASLLVVALCGCDEETMVPEPLPTEIHEVVPATGPSSGGTLVTLHGKFFPENLEVRFGDTLVENLLWVSSSELVVEAPIAPNVGDVGVFIRDLDRESKTAVPVSTAFVYFDPATATEARPGEPELRTARGPIAGGTITLAVATDLHEDAEVWFGLRRAPVLERGADAVLVQAPAAPTGSVALTVQNPDGQFARAGEAFAYYDEEVTKEPLLVQVSPKSGPLVGGTAVTLTGADLPSADAGPLVLFGTKVAAGVTPGEDGNLAAISPGDRLGSVGVTITTAAGLSTRVTNGFTYFDDGQVATLRVLSITPPDGLPAGGTSVVVHGLGFDPAATLHLGDTLVDAVVVDANTITATTLPGADGASIDVTVTNPDTTAASLKEGFTYRTPDVGADLAVVAVSPDRATLAGGIDAVIRGAAFVEGAVVSWGGTELASTYIDDTTLGVVVPEGSPGSVSVSVTVGDETVTLDEAFTYVAADAPQLLAVVPGSGPLAGGNSASLRGSGLQDAESVQVGGEDATEVVVIDDSRVDFTVPMAAQTGPADVVVTFADATTATLTGAYEYLAPDDKLLLAVLPAGGPLTGGNAATLRGTGFVEGATVEFGGDEATDVRVVNDTTIEVTVPAADAAGPVAVRVTFPDETSAELDAAYTYFEPIEDPDQLLVLIAVPSRGALVGGTELTIKGTGFVSGASVRIGGEEADSRFVDGFTLTATSPGADDEGLVDIEVELPDLRAATLRGGFEYVDEEGEPIRIHTISPAFGAVDTLTFAVVTGSGFDPATTLAFDGTDAAVTYHDAATLSVIVPTGDAVGGVEVVAVNGGGSTDTVEEGFFYTDGIGDNREVALTSVTPARGPAAGGSRVVLRGLGFAPDARVRFDRTWSDSVTWVNTTTLSARTPTGAAGPVSVQVVNPSGVSAHLDPGFLYYVPEDGVVPPSVEAVQPDSGFVRGGTPVVLDGAALSADTTVFVGGRPSAQTVFVDDSRLTFVTPQADGPGRADIEVTRGDGHTALLANGFRYFLPAPVLTEVLPSRGPEAGGTIVRVVGDNFVEGASVSFGGRNGRVLGLVDAQNLTVETPAGPTGAVDVVVQNPDGQSAVIPGGFTFGTGIGEDPTLTSVEPGTGPTTGGSRVILHGTHFDADLAVRFGQSPASGITVISTTLATVLTPVGSAGPVDIVVTAGNGGTATLADGFTYYLPEDAELAAPRVTSLSPNRGSIFGGTRASVAGSGFASGVRVFVGGRPAPQVQRSGDSLLTTTTPEGDEGFADVDVTNTDGQTATLSRGFEYIEGIGQGDRPEIASVLPDRGPASGGTRVTLRGSNFQPSLRVLFAGRSATDVVVLGDTLATFRTPSGPAGVTDMTVVNRDGQSDTLRDGFNFVSEDDLGPAPELTGVLPSSGPASGGTEVLLTGALFDDLTLVYFGGRPTRIDAVAQTLLRVSTPEAAPGVADVEVVAGDGQWARLQRSFTYTQDSDLPPPSIDRLVPARGTQRGGTVASVLGSGFRPQTSVFIAGTPAEVRFISEEHLEIVSPAGPAGSADVTAVNDDGQTFTLRGGFTYLVHDPLARTPEVLGVTPDSGAEAGGEEIVISGRNFQATPAVLIGGRPATDVRFISEGLLRAVTPSGQPGQRDVVVTNPSGLSNRFALGFTYVAAPAILDIAPVVGPVGGGTVVSISGQYFQQGAVVLFGERPATRVEVLGPSVVEAVTPASNAGTVDITLINPDEQTSVATGSFSFVPTPDVNEVRPNRGPSFGGSLVLVQGASFRPGARVYFGEEESTQVTFVSEALLTVVLPVGDSGLVGVRVVNPAGQEDTLDQAFTYLSAEVLDDPPTLSAILPAQGPNSGGTWGQAEGTNFEPGMLLFFGRSPAGTVVPYDGTLASFRTAAAVPPGFTGSVNVYAVTTDGQMATLEDGFTFTDARELGDPPQLVRVEPNSGSTAGGQQASLTGTGFAPGALVLVGGRRAGDVRVPAPELTLLETPTGDPGASDVVLTNLDGQSAILRDGYLFVPPPEITSITPNEGPATRATRVTITGARFVSGLGVTVGGEPAAEVRVVDAGTITAAFPAAPGQNYGAQDVVVTNPDGQVALVEDGFTWLAPPQLTSIDPDEGPAAGGTEVQIHGVAFQQGAVVLFGQTRADEVEFLTDRQLSVVSPPGTAITAITVRNPDGQEDTLEGSYTYVPAPRVDSVSPTSGGLNGGSTMTISGNFFQPGAQVWVGPNVAGDITFVSAQVVTCTIPDGAAGPAAVVVQNVDGQRGTLPAAYTYIPPRQPPAVVGITPNFGDEIGGTNVTILGNGFQFGATVMFDGVEAPVSEVLSGTYIRARAPGHDPGTVDVVVTNPDDEEATLADGFTYIARGQLPDIAVTHVIPNTGSALGNDRVTVVGAGFHFGAQITFDGVPCTDIRYVGPTILTCTTGAHATGDVAVSATNPNGDFHTLDGGYTYGFDLKLDLDGWRLPPESLDQWGAVTLDADGDGDRDAFVYDDAYGQAWLYVNDGSGTFTMNDLGRFEPGCENSSSYCRIKVATAGDVDADGDIDILTGHEDRQMGLWRNQGDGTFTRHYVCPDNNCGNSRWRNPGGLALADVNNDGTLDIVVADNDGPNSIAINQGPDGFNGNRAYWEYADGNLHDINEKSNAISVGDVDRDGDIDLLIGNRDEEQNRLYLNEGTGTFVDATGSHFVVSGGNTQGVLLVDVDNDLDLDAIVVNLGQQDRIMLNDGQGHYTDQTFGRIPMDQTGRTTGINFADIDQDGDFDLLTSWEDGARQRILLNLGVGSGIFEDRTSPRLDDVWVFGPREVIVGDWDDDSFPDLMAINNTHQNQLWINDGEGDFTDETYEYMPTQNTNTTSVALGDIDNDGDLDMVQANYWGTDRIYLNDGSGHFFDVTEERFPSSERDDKPWDIQLADINGDGDLDIFVGNFHRDGDRNDCCAPRNYLYANDGAGFFVDRSDSLPTNTQRETFSQVLVDVDGDGDLDYLIANHYHWDNIRLYRNLGDGLHDDTAIFSDVTGAIPLPNEARGNVSALAVTDIDGDGQIDIFAGFAGAQNRMWLRELPDLTYRDVTATHIPGISDNTQDVQFGDFDGDGDVDLFVANWGQRNRLHLNHGDGTFSDVTATNVPDTTRRTRAMARGDLDHDGDVDFVLASADRQRNTVYLQVGNTSFVLADDYTPWDNDRSNDVAVGDLDGDGDLDVVMANDGQSRIYWNKHFP